MCSGGSSGGQDDEATPHATKAVGKERHSLPTKASSRAASLDLKNAANTPSLFKGPVSPTSTGKGKEDQLFAQLQKDPRSTFPKPGDPRTLARTLHHNFQ